MSDPTLGNGASHSDPEFWIDDDGRVPSREPDEPEDSDTEDIVAVVQARMDAAYASLYDIAREAEIRWIVGGHDARAFTYRDAVVSLPVERCPRREYPHDRVVCERELMEAFVRASAGDGLLRVPVNRRNWTGVIYGWTS